MVARQLGPSILPERCYCRNVLPWRAHCILRYLVPHATSSSSTYALFPFRSLFRFRFRFFLLLLFFFFLPFERGMAHTSLCVCARAYTLLSCRHNLSINDALLLLPPSGTEQGMAGGQSDNDKRQPLWSHGGYDVGSPLYIWTAALVRARRVRTYQCIVHPNDSCSTA